MARYRIHRLRESMKEQFRWAAHTGGAAAAKPKDYAADTEVEAATPYALWSRMKGEGRDLCPGDVLEAIREDGLPGELEIFKYIGFEPAKWWIPEPKPEQKGRFEGPPTTLTPTADLHSN
jgi:hypothetical protein